MARPTPTPRTVARANAQPIRARVAEAWGQSTPSTMSRRRCARTVDGLGKNASRNRPAALAHSHAASRTRGEIMAIQCSPSHAAARFTRAPGGRPSRVTSALVGHGAHDLLAQVGPDLL